EIERLLLSHEFLKQRRRTFVGHAGTAIKAKTAGLSKSGVESRAALSVFEIEIGAMLSQELHNLIESLQRGAVERGSPAAIDGVDVNARIQTEFNCLDRVTLSFVTPGGVFFLGSKAGSRHQRIDAVARHNLRIGALLEQYAHDDNITGLCRAQ